MSGRPERAFFRSELPRHQPPEEDLDVSGQQGASTFPSPPPEGGDRVNSDPQIPLTTSGLVRAIPESRFPHGFTPPQVRLPAQPDPQIPRITPEPVRANPASPIPHGFIPPQVRDQHHRRRWEARQNHLSRDYGEEDLEDNLGSSVCTRDDSVHSGTQAFTRYSATISHNPSSGCTTICFYPDPQVRSSCPVLAGRLLNQGPQSLGYLDSQIYFREGNGDTHTLSLSSQKPSYSELNRR
jgi:hypothetical protein